MSNQRIVNSALFVFVILVFVVLNQLFSELWISLDFPDYRILGPIGVPLIIALVITSLGAFLLRRDQRVNPFLLEVVGELKEVTWPTRQEIQTHTTVVILTVLIIALLMGVFDTVWAKVSKFILNPNI